MPIFVLIFWLKVIAANGNVDSVSIDSIEFGGEAKSPQICSTLPMGEVLKSIPDAATKIEAGLVPRVVCGVAAPDTEVYTPDSVPKADMPQAPESNPGHGVWGNGTSGEL
jgi:hypothetical protein